MNASPANELPARKFPSEFSTIVPEADDLIPIADAGDPDNTMWKATVQSIAQVWSWSLTTDDIAEWSNLYFTDERAKDSNKRDYTAISTNTTVTDADHLNNYAVDTSWGTVIITLPSVATVGEWFRIGILKTDVANQVTVTPDWSDTISEWASLVVTTDNDFRAIVSDWVSNWFVDSSVISTAWDVTWPWSSVDDNIALFNWATWKIIKDSGVGIISSDTFTWATSTNINTATETKNYIDNLFNTEATTWWLWTVQRWVESEFRDDSPSDTAKYASISDIDNYYSMKAIAWDIYSLNTNMSQVIVTDLTYTKAVETESDQWWTFTVVFEMKASWWTAFGRIYVNGIAVWTERSTTSSSFVSYNEDIAISNGDLVQIYAYNTVWANTIINAFTIQFWITLNRFSSTINL